MRAEHLEILVEEPSMEAFLHQILPRLLSDRATYKIHVHRGKLDLLRKLGDRLNGYTHWLPPTHRIVVVIDKDDDDCTALKMRIEEVARGAGLQTRSTCGANQPWRVVSRLAIEELEAWYFGDWESVTEAYPRLPTNIPAKAAFRDPDAISGGTWEALERILKRAGYFPGGLQKIKVASDVGRFSNPTRNSSRSFQVFREALSEAVALDSPFDQ